ncbi:2673_t:CDS:2 [Gigaspora margarita]|uniref:2673_t:CDS:1 n=1 Tax=Gigaspora margarita TaxID=4874 RepID=A0ABM8VX08_GIGMA|nr:2673_t:CDS:2 [Gigaspora margarita]
MDDGRWAILFDQEYIRAEDYKRCLQTVNDFNFFIDELPDLLRKDTLVELNQCSNCHKISLPQRSQDEDMQQCYRQKYSHQIERVASCDTISSLPEHAGYRSSNHKHSYTLTSLDQLKGIKFDLLHFFDILKNCVDSLRPEVLSHKWDIHFEPVSLGKRMFYSGNFGNTDWKEYIKIDGIHEALEIYTRFLETLPKKLYNWALYKCLDCNAISSNSRIIGPCWQTNNWFDENHYLPQMPHKFEKIENVDVFLNSKVSLNILGKSYAQRNNL